MQSDASPCLPLLVRACVWLGWDGGRECFLWKAEDLYSVCVSAPTLPVSQSSRGVTPCPGLQHPRAPQLQWDFSLSHTFEGTASARCVSGVKIHSLRLVGNILSRLKLFQSLVI